MLYTYGSFCDAFCFFFPFCRGIVAGRPFGFFTSPRIANVRGPQVVPPTRNPPSTPPSSGLIHRARACARRREANWLDLEGNRHQDYFRRQEKKEKALYGVGRGQKYNASRQRSDVIERVRLRREARLKRDRARRSTDKNAAEDDVCSIS